MLAICLPEKEWGREELAKDPLVDLVNYPWVGEVLAEPDENNKILVHWYQAATTGSLTGVWRKYTIKRKYGPDEPYTSVREAPYVTGT